MKKRKRDEVKNSCDEIVLNVGGTRFSTCLVTLNNAPESQLSKRFDVYADPSAPAFIDRDPTLFRHILNWLRSQHLDQCVNTIESLKDLKCEADFFCIKDLVMAIDSRIDGILKLPRTRWRTVVEANSLDRLLSNITRASNSRWMGGRKGERPFIHSANMSWDPPSGNMKYLAVIGNYSI
jgi:hypothetical protein